MKVFHKLTWLQYIDALDYRLSAQYNNKSSMTETLASHTFNVLLNSQEVDLPRAHLYNLREIIR